MTRPSVPELRALVDEWIENSAEACRQWQPQPGNWRMEGQCERCGRNSWAHVWRLAADKLSDQLTLASLDPLSGWRPIASTPKDGTAVPPLDGRAPQDEDGTG